MLRFDPDDLDQDGDPKSGDLISKLSITDLLLSAVASKQEHLAVGGNTCDDEVFLHGRE